MNETATQSNSTSLPPRLRESAFRKYEDVIAQIVDAYPQAVKCNIGDASPVTFSARLRDAITSLYTNGWQTSKVKAHLFRPRYPDLVVSHRSNGVFAGSREAIKLLEEVSSRHAESTPSTEPARVFERVDAEVEPLDLNNLTRDEVKFLCLLASQRAFVRPLRLTTSWMDTENQEWFEANYDVTLTKDTTTNSYLLS